MNTGKLVGLAIIVVVIAPVLVGFVWPTGTEDIDSWEAEPAMDITGDLSNRSISVYDTYTGPLNNLTIYKQSQDALVFPSPRSETDNPNSYPVSDIEGSAQAQSLTISDMLGTGKARYGIGSTTGFTITGDATVYTYGDFWPATNVLVLYDEDTNPVKTLTPAHSDVITGDIAIITFGEPRAYVDLNDGLGGSLSWWAWLNGLHNKSVDIWIQMTHTGFPNTIYVDSLEITWNNGLTVTDGTETKQLGKVYEFIDVKLEEGKATVTGLIGVNSFTDSTYSEGNSLEFSRSGTLDAIAMRGTYMGWWVKSTTSAIASTTGISDSSFVPEDYYASHSWQVQVINPSTFGSSIVIATDDETQILTYSISEGRTIHITNLVTGEASDVPVRGLRILSLVLDGKQEIFIDGMQVMSIATPQNITVTLEGDWYTSVILSKVTQSTTTSYTWNIGNFGLDQAGFCFVGLLSCVAVAIAGSLWGRTSGESTLALHITMILCGIAYLVML